MPDHLLHASRNEQIEYALRVRRDNAALVAAFFAIDDEITRRGLPTIEGEPR
jgi:hypothetical protein